MSLAVAAVLSAPFAASGATNPASVAANTIVNANVVATISISATAGTVTLSLSPTTTTVESAVSNVINVTTNDSAGYTLTMIDGNTVTTLASTTPVASFAATTGTFAAPALLTANKWGYHLDSMGGVPGTGATENSVATPTTIKYAGPQPSSGTADTLASPSAATAGGGTNLTVWYGAQADNTQPSSSSGYTDTVVYTATGK